MSASSPVYIRSSLARALYTKYINMENDKDSKHEEWYTVRQDLIPIEILSLFAQSRQDNETEEFLKNCYEKSDCLFTQLYHTLAKSFLSLFVSSTTANGLLNRGSMFVLSREQFMILLDIPDDYKTYTLLDLGSGDGNVTKKMESFFERVFVTEASSGMKYRLRQKDIDEWEKRSSIQDYNIESQNGFAQYNVISCLNLLDRCEMPLTLLAKVKSALKPGSGRFILALVFPLKQYVEYGSSNKPIEEILISGSQYWETQFVSFIKTIMEPMGFKLIKWTRLAYLCEGDFSQSFFYLNNVVMVFKV